MTDEKPPLDWGQVKWFCEAVAASPKIRGRGMRAVVTDIGNTPGEEWAYLTVRVRPEPPRDVVF